MATRTPPGMSQAQAGHARKTIVVDGVVRDVSVPWRGVVRLTRDLAEQLWAMRAGNPRDFVHRLAVKYANEMRSGAWGMVYPSEIIVTSNGVLGNGQHRVGGVLACGVAINVELVLGVDPDALAYMDCGRNRSMSVRYRMIDDSKAANDYASAIASALIRVATYVAGTSIQDVSAIDAVYGDSIRLVAHRLSSINRRKGIGRAGVSAAVVQYHHHSPEAAVEFMDSLYAPDGDVQPARMLRDHLLMAGSSAGAQATLTEYERACSAIGAHMRGEDIKIVKRRKEHPCGPVQFSRPKIEKLDWSFV